MNTITKTYTITLINETKGINQTIQVSPEEYILDVAEAEGMTLPYSCRNGSCLDCLGKLVEGQVEQTVKALEFLSLEEIEAGYILTCAACPRSNCTIFTDQAEELFS
ncbi:ferredoxin (2Fe-2S) [Stanieria sp. NIES-3757]|nr:ferredoxin (2Fe-2S) [Stanieria sp. NIES-3757]